MTYLLDLLAQVKPLQGYRTPILSFILALIVSMVITPYVRKLAFAKGAVDDPKRDNRRIHKEPLPRWGGMAIYAGYVVAVVGILPFFYKVPFPRYVLAMLVVGGILVVIGALDDLFEFSAKLQALLLLGAGILVQFIYDPSLQNGRIQIQSFDLSFNGAGNALVLANVAPWLPVFITAIYIFVITKTMDTIDGVDGLAAGISAISATTIAILGAYGGQPRVAIIAAAIGGGACGFLRHNYNPAKIIMGTGGAYILGFTLACLSIVGAMKTAAAVSLVVPILIFGVPIFDAFQVVIRRIASGSPITQADKRHVHHTLLGKGLSQRQTVTVLYSIALLLSSILVYMAVSNRG